MSGTGFVTPVPVRWSDIDMYQHVNHAMMVTMLEEARIPFLANAFGADITTTGLLIAEVKVTYKGQLRLVDSPLQVTIWVNRLRAVDFTLGYEVRSVNADPDSKPAVIAETQLAAFDIDEQRSGAAVPGSPRVSRAVVAIAERGLWLPDAADRNNLMTFAERALRLDDAAVVRLRSRSDTTVIGWVATGFDVLACRAVGGRVRPDDLSAGADALVRAVTAAGRDGYVDTGYAMDSAWRGVLPPATGFVHLDDIPARVMLDLAQRGVALAREHGAHRGRRFRCSIRT